MNVLPNLAGAVGCDNCQSSMESLVATRRSTSLLGHDASPTGDRGSLTLYGENLTHHRLLAEHLTAEYRVQTIGRGRTVDEWKMRPEQTDNHWLDGLVGCAVAASIQGTSLLGEKASGGKKLRMFVLPGNARAR